MATHYLTDQFQEMQSDINLGDRERVAIACHRDVREVLHQSQELRDHELRDLLIGSYARGVAIYPGKDVDVLGLLEAPNGLTPGQLYDMFGRALDAYDQQGRLTPQPRSFKITFGPDGYPTAAAMEAAAADYGWDLTEARNSLSAVGRERASFCVDIVPARPCGEHIEIPEKDTVADPSSGELRAVLSGGWVLTSPLKLNEQTRTLNANHSVSGQGSYVPTTKAIKQIKRAHLDQIKPGGLFYEFIIHEGFTEGRIGGDTWADVTHSALSYIRDRLDDVEDRPVVDPVLKQAYAPAPSPGALAQARDQIRTVAATADRAVRATDRCTAASAWQSVFGGNERIAPVFPMPPGCSGSGLAYGASGVGVTAQAATGGTTEQGFGGH